MFPSPFNDGVYAVSFVMCVSPFKETMTYLNSEFFCRETTHAVTLGKSCDIRWVRFPILQDF